MKANGVGFVLPIQSIEGAIWGMLKDEATDETRVDLTEIDVVEAFEAVVSSVPTDASESELEQLLRVIIAAAIADISEGSGPITQDHVPWLNERKHEISWRRWGAFRKLLAAQNRSGRVLKKLDRFTDEILDLVGDPQSEGNWNRRGLLIGDVQSGKTQNYLALINKAADAGYRLIIILSGNTEYLRRQTHERVDEGFIGRDTKLAAAPKGVSIRKDPYIGIGQIDKSIATATSLTTVLMDYLQVSKRAVAAPLPGPDTGPVVFVLKKNKYVLDAVDEWAMNHAGKQDQNDLPVLLLDDESDYASVNTNEAEDPTAINAAIRRILSRFTRSSYVAITATPFANIFIDDEATGVVGTKEDGEVEDLFPENYIYPLEAPSNYVGIRAVFGTDETDQPATVVSLTDAQEWIPIKHKKDQPVGTLPTSMREAIKAFVLANAILDGRAKAPKNRSMLINVSRFTAVQDGVGELVDDELARLKNAISLHGESYLRGTPNAAMAELKTTYLGQFSSAGGDWESVCAMLHKSVADIRVKVYNSGVNKNGEDEEFEDDVPERQIAVGGDLLSRGLTLSNLLVSYFHRSVGAADTMMQMARWFGYRDGYADLCRLWISPKAAADYRFVGSAIEELREDLAFMRHNEMTPRDFGLAVKEHPESLLITARNKSKHALSSAKEVNLLGQNLETRKLSTETSVQEKNRSALDQLIAASDNAGCVVDRTRRKYVRINQVPKGLVADFLSVYKSGPDDVLFTESVLEKMVRSSKGAKFESWDLVFVNGARKDTRELDLVPGHEIYAVERTLLWREPNEGKRKAKWSSLWVSGANTRLAGSDDLRMLLSEEAEEDARKAFRRAHFDSGSEVPANPRIAEKVFYRYLPRPQLLVYSLAPKASAENNGIKFTGVPTPEVRAKAEELAENEMIGLKLALPTSVDDFTSRNGRAKYLLNKVAQKYWSQDYEDLA